MNPGLPGDVEQGHAARVEVLSLAHVSIICLLRLDPGGVVGNPDSRMNPTTIGGSLTGG